MARSAANRSCRVPIDLRVPRRVRRALRRFLDASFAALRREVPEAYGAMCGALAPRALRLDVDGERVTIRFEPRRVVEVDADAARVAADDPADDPGRDRRPSLAHVGRARGIASSCAGRRSDVPAFHDAFMRLRAGRGPRAVVSAAAREFRERDHSEEGRMMPDRTDRTVRRLRRGYRRPHGRARADRARLRRDGLRARRSTSTAEPELRRRRHGPLAMGPHRDPSGPGARMRARRRDGQHQAAAPSDSCR